MFLRTTSCTTQHHFKLPEQKRRSLASFFLLRLLVDGSLRPQVLELRSSPPGEFPTLHRAEDSNSKLVRLSIELRSKRRTSHSACGALE